ncbi:hypothetical protein CDD82_7984 [Ophiocordyceps australis]|uniref:ATP-dependent RNA helicase n=1 Tax=Ophiocordyceps australis TaxID=1399860 RepID=A0A2C5XT69_9HYPO|nr:hypothetical protein CDD82_7984 [Ophiocordyceps australis]
MYARYIPPPKAAAAAVTTKPLAATGSFSYARYVPPPKSASSAPEDSRTGAKRRREPDDQAGVAPDSSVALDSSIAPDSSVGPDSSVAPDSRAKKKKKNRRKRKQSTRDSSDELSDSESRDCRAKEHQKEQTGVDATRDKREHKKEHQKEHQKEQTGVDATRHKREHKSLLQRKEKSLELASMMAQDTRRESESEGQVHGLEPLPQPASVPADGDEAKASYETLPGWLANPMRVEEGRRTAFGDLGMPDSVCKALENKGFSEAFAVQEAAIRLLLATSKRRAGDVLISASTGSGKTLGYALPLMADVSQGLVTRLRALVVLPTRELVKQAHEVLEFCADAWQGGGRKRARVGTAVGSQAMAGEQDRLVEGEGRYGGQGPVGDPDDGPVGDLVDYASKVDVLVCTPGRLVEHLEQTAGFSLGHVRWLVVDEADKLLGQSYQGWLGAVRARLGAVRKVIVSATLPRELGLVSQLALWRPTLVDVGAQHSLPASLAEVAMRVADSSLKPLYLLHLLRGQHMGDALPQALIFTKSNEAALRLARLLVLVDAALAPCVATMTSTTPSHERRRTLRAFASPSAALRLLVASDLVARGIDIAQLAHVVNYDVAPTVAAYVHRVGRTARAGHPGCAWSLVADAESGWFWRCIGKSSHLARAAPVRRLALPDLPPDAIAAYHQALARLAAEAHDKQRP